LLILSFKKSSKSSKRSHTLSSEFSNVLPSCYSVNELLPLFLMFAPVGAFRDSQQVSLGLRPLRSILPDQLWERTAKIQRFEMLSQVFHQIFFHKKFTFCCGKLYLIAIDLLLAFFFCAHLFRKADAKVSTGA
jgi:hypothetical protein